MSDPRWVDIESDVARAVAHFAKAQEIDQFRTGPPAGSDFYIASMAFMHAMQSAHTSIETAMVRILDMLDEVKPTGPDWHDTLIRRLARPIEGEHARPALLTEALAKALVETKNFRHRAMHTYDDFDFDRARPAIKAASVVVEDIAEAIAAFRSRIDP